MKSLWDKKLRVRQLQNILLFEPPEIKTNHFMLSSQELSLVLPLILNRVNSRFCPILSKVDKILIKI